MPTLIDRFRSFLNPATPPPAHNVTETDNNIKNPRSTPPHNIIDRLS